MSLARRPAAGATLRVSYVLALLAGLAAVAAVAVSPLALAAGGVGWLALFAGVVRQSRGAVVFGGGVCFAAALVAATGGAGVGAVLAGAFGAVLAADLGLFGLGLDRDVDGSVATTRVELLHAVASGSVALATAGGGYVLYRSVPTGGSTGVVALLLGGVVLVTLLR